MKQIFIEDYRIDVNRCEVQRGTETTSLEPKVVQVLLLLAKHQGEVVSHQTLLEEVWPNIIVEANALQRCIGQLRKVFNDDAKQQRVIATYPKNGYSLVLPVRQDTLLNQDKAKIRILYPALTAAVLLIAAVFILRTFINSQPSELLTIATPQEILSTDFYAMYSSDGLYVAYTRPLSSNSQVQNLWLQDLSTEEEFLLSANAGIYNDVAWSPDNQSLIFIESTCLSSTCQQLECSSLNLHVLDAPSSEQMHILQECRSERLSSPQWISNNNIVLIEENDIASNIINYNLNLSSSETFFQQEGINFQHLSFSAETDALAVIANDQNNQQQLFLLSVTTKEFIALNPDLPTEVMNEPWYPIWNQDNNGLIITSSEGIFTINLDGSVSKQNSPFMPQLN